MENRIQKVRQVVDLKALRDAEDYPEFSAEYKRCCGALCEYIDRMRSIKDLNIKLVSGDQEPFSTVAEFMTRCAQETKIWIQHYFTFHPFMDSDQYVHWRAVHDIYGHQRVFEITNGRYGHFNLRGEIDALVCMVEMDLDQCSRPVDFVEAIIVETIIRNIKERPAPSKETRALAERILECLSA